MVCKDKCEYEQVYKLSAQKERKSRERNDVQKQVETRWPS